jgi:hypothetical protein
MNMSGAIARLLQSVSRQCMNFSTTENTERGKISVFSVFFRGKKSYPILPIFLNGVGFSHTFCIFVR